MRSPRSSRIARMNWNSQIEASAAGSGGYKGAGCQEQAAGARSAPHWGADKHGKATAALGTESLRLCGLSSPNPQTPQPQRRPTDCEALVGDGLDVDAPPHRLEKRPQPVDSLAARRGGGGVGRVRVGVADSVGAWVATARRRTRPGPAPACGTARRCPRLSAAAQCAAPVPARGRGAAVRGAQRVQHARCGRAHHGCATGRALAIAVSMLFVAPCATPRDALLCLGGLYPNRGGRLSGPRAADGPPLSCGINTQFSGHDQARRALIHHHLEPRGSFFCGHHSTRPACAIAFTAAPSSDIAC